MESNYRPRVSVASNLRAMKALFWVFLLVVASALTMEEATGQQDSAGIWRLPTGPMVCRSTSNAVRTIVDFTFLGDSSEKRHIVAVYDAIQGTPVAAAIALENGQGRLSNANAIRFSDSTFYAPRTTLGTDSLSSILIQASEFPRRPTTAEYAASRDLVNWLWTRRCRSRLSGGTRG